MKYKYYLVRICTKTTGEGCSLLKIYCSLKIDLDEVLVPVFMISTSHLQRPRIRRGHVTISRHSSWVHLDDCPHLPRHACPGAQQTANSPWSAIIVATSEKVQLNG